MDKTPDVLRAAANLFEERNKTYKNTTKPVGEVFRALFPEGITEVTWQDHERFHILSLMIVKLVRYCNNWNKGGHQDSIEDLTVYSGMLAAIDAEQRNVRQQEKA